MNVKNVEYANYDFYLNDLVKSLSNFCNKSPLKPIIKVAKELGKIYVYYDEKSIEIDIDITKNKKFVIGELKKQLEKDYPIIYKKILKSPSADEVRSMLNQGKSLEEALNCNHVEYEKIYKIERVHDRYNELDVYSFCDEEMYKFKAKIPLVVLIEDLKHLGRDSNAIDNLNFLYKLNSVDK